MKGENDCFASLKIATDSCGNTLVKPEIQPVQPSIKLSSAISSTPPNTIKRSSKAANNSEIRRVSSVASLTETIFGSFVF